MRAQHLEIMVEEPSMEAFLRGFMPKILQDRATFEVYPHRCKEDLLKKLPQRLQGYAAWLPAEWRIIVLVDSDDDDCRTLKAQLDQEAATAGLLTRATAAAAPWRVVNRIVIEELEAWYFGDWRAVVQSYPRVRRNITRSAGYRNSDTIIGGTWEHFERILQNAGYFGGGLRKIEAARVLAQHSDPSRNQSLSFSAFHAAVLEAIADVDMPQIA